MRKCLRVLAAPLGAVLALVGMVSVGWSAVMSRTEAVERAVSRSLELARLEQAGTLAARLGKAAPYPVNPLLSVDVAGSSSPFSSREYSRGIALEQELDLRGERGARRRVGQATSVVAARELEARRQAITAAVDEAVGRWLVAAHRKDLLLTLVQHARSIDASAEEAKRRETVTAFATRLLKADAVAFEAEAVEASREQDQAAAELRGWLAFSPTDSLGFTDDLSDSSWRCSPDSVLALARRSRALLAEAAAAESLAESRLSLERRLGRVNPTLGVSAARERTFIESAPVSGGGVAGPIQDSDTVFGLRASVPLPLMQRNQVGVGEAALELQRVQAERGALDLAVAQEVTSACAALSRAESRQGLLRDVAQGVSGDLDLTEAAYRGGRIPLEDYLTLRERLIRIRRDLIDATGAVEEARARLVRATGLRRDLLTAALRAQSR